MKLVDESKVGEVSIWSVSSVLVHVTIGRSDSNVNVVSNGKTALP